MRNSLKKKIYQSLLFFVIAFILTSFQMITKAQVSCPSLVMNCSEIDYRGGCQEPCIRVVTQQGIRVPAKCQCQQTINSPGSVSLGQPCQQDSDCAPPGKYCWGDLGKTPVCHETTSTEARQTEVGGDSSPLKNNCIDTAIGCIPIDIQDMVTFILKWAIGVASGVAFILIVIASFQIMTSQGDPKRLQAGKELLSSAIMGIILLIFSVFILRVIGVNILGIPGLS